MVGPVELALIALLAALTAGLLAFAAAARRRRRRGLHIDPGQRATPAAVVAQDLPARWPFREESEAGAGTGVAEQPAPIGPPPGAMRRVVTPDGPMVLTRPPFRLRRSMLQGRERMYARELSVRLPSGYVLCAQVRLESLLTPSESDMWDAGDYAEWRRRARWRSVDFVVCRLPEWAPVVAIEVDPTEGNALRATRDLLLEEALGAVGLPLVRCGRTPKQDWPAIAAHLA